MITQTEKNEIINTLHNMLYILEIIEKKDYTVKKSDYDEMFKYYNDLASELTSRIAKALDYMENYIEIESENYNSNAVKIEFKEVIKILKGEDD